MSFNLGNVVGLIKRATEPAKKYVLWGKIIHPSYPDEVEVRYYNPESAQWDLMDATFQYWLPAITAAGVNTPPVSPALGATYIVGSSPTGAWAGKTNYLARWRGNNWTFISPKESQMCKVVGSPSSFYAFDSGAWSLESFSPTSSTAYVPIGGTSTGIPITGDMELDTNGFGPIDFYSNETNAKSLRIQGDRAVLRNRTGSGAIMGVVNNNLVANGYEGTYTTFQPGGIGNFFGSGEFIGSNTNSSDRNFFWGTHTAMTATGSSNFSSGLHSNATFNGNYNTLSGQSTSTTFNAGSTTNYKGGAGNGVTFNSGASNNFVYGNGGSSLFNGSNNFLLGGAFGITFQGSNNGVFGGGAYANFNIGANNNIILNEAQGDGFTGVNNIKMNGLFVNGCLSSYNLFSGQGSVIIGDSASNRNAFFNLTQSFNISNSSNNFFSGYSEGTYSNVTNSFFTGTRVSNPSFSGISDSKFLATFIGGSYSGFFHYLSGGLYNNVNIDGFNVSSLSANLGGFTMTGGGPKNNLILLASGATFTDNVGTNNTYIGVMDMFTGGSNTGNVYLGLDNINLSTYSSITNRTVMKNITMPYNGYWMTVTMNALTGNKNLYYPDENGTLATQQYVTDSITNALDNQTWKESVVMKTTANITLSGTAFTVDGVPLNAGNRILVANQTDQTENGIYIVGSGAWSRSTDANTGGELATATVYVEQGTTHGGQVWTCGNSAIILGTTNVTFVQTGGLNTYTNGAGLDLTGNTFSISTNGVTNSMLRQSSQYSIIGRSSSGTGNVADIQATSLGVLRYDGASTFGFGTIGDSYITSLAWSKITSTPTTVAGYGITDAVTLTGTETLTNKTLTSATLTTPQINMGSDAAGDIYYRNGSGVTTRLGIGSNGDVLTVSSGAPVWATPSGGGIGGSIANNQIAYGNGSNITGSNNFTWNGTSFILTQTAATSGAPSIQSITGAAHTGLTASAEIIDVNYQLTRIVQRATGAVTTQRAFLITAPTYSFVGASIITEAATFAISGAPTAGTNATISNAYALWVQGGITRLGGDLLGSATQNIFNTVTTTANIIGAATSITMGAASGTATIRNTTVALSGGTLTGAATQNVFNTTSTTVNAFGAATTATFGGTPTGALTVNFFTNATASANTKTLNIGTGGAASSTTNINIGSTSGGTITFNSTIVGQATQNIFNTVSTTVNCFDAATTFNLSATNAGALTANLFTGATGNIINKIINIGTNGVSGSITNINLGSQVSGATGTIVLGGGVVRIQNAATAVTGFGTANIIARNSTTGNLESVAASGGGTTNFLRADGTWAVPSGGSTVLRASKACTAEDGGTISAWTATTDFTYTITVTGATTSMNVVANLDNAMFSTISNNTFSMDAWISATNTVKVRVRVTSFINVTGNITVAVF